MCTSPAKLPFIVLSHGTGGAAMGLAWLGETLAANGYVVAAVNHHGNTGAEPTQPLQGTLVSSSGLFTRSSGCRSLTSVLRFSKKETPPVATLLGFFRGGFSVKCSSYMYRICPLPGELGAGRQSAQGRLGVRTYFDDFSPVPFLDCWPKFM